MELHIKIKDDKDFAVQIYDQIAAAIENGRLADGQQVPPTRLLAKQLGVARKSVAEAYNRLTYDKKLVGHVGRGTFVSHPSTTKAVCEVIQPPVLSPPSLQKWEKIAHSDRMASKRRCVVNFTGGVLLPLKCIELSLFKFVRRDLLFIALQFETQLLHMRSFKRLQK